MDLEIKINVKENKIKGFITHHGKCENSYKCNSFNNGLIEGEVNEKGKFVKFKIKQNSNLGKMEGAYTVKGNFKKSTIYSRDQDLTPKVNFSWTKVEDMNKTTVDFKKKDMELSERCNDQNQSTNVKKESEDIQYFKSNIKIKFNGVYDVPPYGNIDAWDCNTVPIEIFITIKNKNIVEGEIINKYSELNSNIPNNKCTQYHWKNQWLLR